MIRFNNDYNHGAQPSILKKLMETNDTAYGGYGVDEWCGRAEEEIRIQTGQPDAKTYFISGGTQANTVVLAAALLPVQSVICAESGHINAHEAASIEHIGHKCLGLAPTDGKINADQVRKKAALYFNEGEPEFLTEPKVVYISFPTETGTLYTLEELKELRKACDEFGMYLFVDGARLGYGLGSCVNDVTLKDLAALADVFYMGGTKCGAMFGEAVVIRNEQLKPRFKMYMKQNGAVLAKGWLMGLQFHTLLTTGEYFSATARADEMALRIRKAFEEKGIPLAENSYTNQQFVIVTPEQEKKLAEDFIFERICRYEDGRKQVRFCTSWATKEEEVQALIDGIQAL